MGREATQGGDLRLHHKLLTEHADGFAAIHQQAPQGPLGLKTNKYDGVS